ncbi:ParB/RepB/Spo0J family partition protein, partial [bacterium]|nr:ParB/RepB/Spo0J family partition protein [bacterium]
MGLGGAQTIVKDFIEKQDNTYLFALRKSNNEIKFDKIYEKLDKEDKELEKTLTPRILNLLKEHNVDDVLEGEIIDEIELSLISPNPYQPRKMFDEEKINELTSSIKEHGVFQPIILKKTTKGFVIVSGERRFRASKLVGLKTVPAIIR